jgi:hypothetical protein
MADNNTVLLRVTLDEGKTEAQLKQLVLDIEATRKAQAALTLERKAGTVADEEFAKRTVELRTELKGQQASYAGLQKNLDLYRTATGELGNSYAGQQAQLSLAQRTFQQLAGSQDLSTESAQELNKVIGELRQGLFETDKTSGLFARNIGNYPSGSEGLEKLVQQLVNLQEQQKRTTAGSQEAQEVTRQIGFVQQAAAQQGAKLGKTYEETTDFVRQYGDAIRPATADLIKLTEQQQQLAESSEDVSEQTAQIGFRMGAAQKAIKDATDALKAEAAAAGQAGEESQTLGQGLKEVAGQNTLVAATTEKYGAAKEKFTQATNLAKLAIGGEVTALGLLRLAIIATGLGALVLVLGSVVTFLTKTAEGTRLVENVMAQVGAVVNVLTDRFGMLGKAITQVFSGDFTGAANTAKAAVAGIGDEVQREVKLAGDLSKAQQQLNRDRQANADTNKRLLRDEENLKNLRDDESKSLAVRRKANEDAFAVEQKREAILVGFAQRQLDIYKQQVAARGGRDRADKELLDQLADAETELADVQEDAAGRRNEYITNRFQLAKDSLDKEKEAETAALDKRIALRKDALALEAQLIERQLQTTQQGSDKELSLLQQRLRNSYQAELNVKDLTVSAKKVIDARYENETLKLEADARKQRILAAYDAEAASVSAELTLVQQGTQQETELRREAIDTQLRKELAALDQRKDNAAQEQLLRANAAKAINDVNYAAALTSLEQYLQDERNAIDESFARGILKEEEYNKAVLTSDVSAAASRLQLAKSFTQSTVAQEQQLTTAKIASIRAVTEAERAEQEKRIVAAQSLAEGLTALFADTVATTGATLQDFARKSLILIIDTVEKQIIADQIKIISQAFASAESLATFGIAGIAKSAAIIGLVLGATETLKAKLRPSTDQFADGTVLGGASHAQGGVQLFSRSGHHFGEAEKDEVILTKGVWQNPLLRPLASQLNVLGGGKALTGLPEPRMALGGVAQPLMLEQLRGNAAAPIDYARLANAVSKLNVKATISDVQTGLNRAAETQRLSNS